MRRSINIKELTPEQLRGLVGLGILDPETVEAEIARRKRAESVALLEGYAQEMMDAVERDNRIQLPPSGKVVVHYSTKHDKNGNRVVVVDGVSVTDASPIQRGKGRAVKVITPEGDEFEFPTLTAMLKATDNRVVEATENALQILKDGRRYLKFESVLKELQKIDPNFKLVRIEPSEPEN